MRCESGGIGRRTRLRIWRGNPWGFESPLSHQIIEAPLILLILRRGSCRSKGLTEGSQISSKGLIGQWPQVQWNPKEFQEGQGDHPVFPSVSFRVFRGEISPQVIEGD